MTDIQLRKLQSAEFRDILARNKVVTIRIFGSVARGADTEQSDMDFLVEFEDTADLLDMVSLKLSLEEFFQKTVHVVTPSSVSKYLRDSITKESVPVYG